MAFEGTREVFARTEQNMLNAVARALTRAKNGLNVYVSVRHIARDAEGEINTNLTRDFLGYFGDNAREQCKAAGASIEFTEQAGKSVRSTADSAFFESSPLMKSFVSNMAKNANADYVSAAAKAKLRSTAVSNEQAVREAVHDLAERGLFVNTYTGKNGRTINVPVDVGVRQALQNSGKQRRMAQTLEIAEQTGNDLVEVNRTGNCRASHAEWQGGIYSISGKSSKYKSFYKACHVGDPVIGIGGYNCGHEFRIYRASQGRKFQDPITDPTYTTEQVRELTSKQRYYERKLRALKREREMLKSAGLEHAEVSRKITGTQNALKSLIANNKTVLTRQATRERVSPSVIKKEYENGKIRYESATDKYDNKRVVPDKDIKEILDHWTLSSYRVNKDPNEKGKLDKWCSQGYVNTDIYRGTQVTGEQILGSLKVGDLFDEVKLRGSEGTRMRSFSTDKRVANSFAVDSNGMHVILHANKASRASSIKGLAGEFEDEDEVIVGANTKWRIMNITHYERDINRKPTNEHLLVDIEEINPRKLE